MKNIRIRTPTYFGHRRSKALNATPRTWKGNHQKFQILLPNGKIQTIYISVRAWRTLNKKVRLASSSNPNKQIDQEAPAPSKTGPIKAIKVMKKIKQAQKKLILIQN